MAATSQASSVVPAKPKKTSELQEGLRKTVKANGHLGGAHFSLERSKFFVGRIF
jgi:hypothetical protein